MYFKGSSFIFWVEYFGVKKKKKKHQPDHTAHTLAWQQRDRAEGGWVRRAGRAVYGRTSLQVQPLPKSRGRRSGQGAEETAPGRKPTAGGLQPAGTGRPMGRAGRGHTKLGDRRGGGAGRLLPEGPLLGARALPQAGSPGCPPHLPPPRGAQPPPPGRTPGREQGGQGCR